VCSYIDDLTSLTCGYDVKYARPPLSPQLILSPAEQRAVVGLALGHVRSHADGAVHNHVRRRDVAKLVGRVELPAASKDKFSQFLGSSA
jgi:hypothetical protein